MNLENLIAIKDDDDFLKDKTIEKVFHSVSIDKIIALPILCSHSFNKDNEIILEYEPTKRKGISIGKIKFLKGVKKQIMSLPDDERICFYIDNEDEVIPDETHTFKYDYLVIDAKYFTAYRRKYKKTSALWGGFFHIEDKPEIKFDKKKATSTIFIRKELKIPNSIYMDNLFLSINEPNPFNRFLKLYHLLELRFDLHTAEKISKLLNQGNKEREISSKLKEYSREEINRLQSIIAEKCLNIEELTNKLNLVKPFENKAYKIFYEYGKTSNPLKSKDFKLIMANPSLFEKDGITKLNLVYEKIIAKLSAYWIYRIRSSIAHNKFGEYIMDKNDEEFIIEFAEPLLKEIVIQSFKI